MDNFAYVLFNRFTQQSQKVEVDDNPSSSVDKDDQKQNVIYKEKKFIEEFHFVPSDDMNLKDVKNKEKKYEEEKEKKDVEEMEKKDEEDKLSEKSHLKQ